MINRIKNRIKTFVDVRVNLIKNQERLNQQTVFYYNQLAQLFDEESFIPFSAWAISPDTVLHVLNDITINKKQCVVEFGAGASTFYIAKLIKVLRLDTKFYAIESDRGWADELSRQLEVYKLNEFVKIIHASLKEAPSEITLNNQVLWYDTGKLNHELKDISKIDLILVDGPFGGSTPYARYSALPFLKAKIDKGCSIYLDDINRDDEREIAFEWKKLMNKQMQFINRYAVLKDNSLFDVKPLQLTNLH
ncbi:class I SAM-dependent methyltransferase [Christiangramia sp. OXR-203]|uniref:class I SAM-dependent methyltransferase n=1 Tax=Christiangramia sp. OXR-203 TaxID=3100176 RepID=UPI002AC8FBB6|nr:class I SAM-dependent methyltransferase [Christiangramia sp. OXR-203]WPY97914.1 class I SAM-dependent methyltransferase [Christiangramia sp. OXR-203]